MTIFKRNKKESDKSSINRIDSFEAGNIMPFVPRYRSHEDVRMDYLQKYFYFRIEQDIRSFGTRFMMGVDHPAIQSYRASIMGNFMEAAHFGQLDRMTRESEHMLDRLVQSFFSGMGIWMKIAKDELKFGDILKIQDIEQRMVALKRYGVEKILYDTKAVLIQKSLRGNELYMIPIAAGLFHQNAYYLKYSDPSTGRIYISGVPPEMGVTKDADACMAWKHGLSVEAYKILFEEA